MQIKSIQPGLWSSPATWDGGHLPASTDVAIIGHNIQLDIPVTIAGMTINAMLMLDNTKNVTIQSSGNIVVSGTLQSIPNIDVSHLIQFIGIDENKFVGGGDVVLDSDVGIWVIGAGQLVLQGSLTDSWNIGGDIIGNILSIVERAVNLPRNMRIEGTITGYSHVFIKSSTKQIIRYVGLRYLGPRKDRDGNGIQELVTGRYAIHFHHSEDGSRGSIIEGCIANDCNNHCYVPHGSHGITFRDNAAINVIETAFWYDLGHKTNDLLWEGNLVANVGFFERSLDQDSGDAPTFGAGGFVLGFGDGNVCRKNIVYQTSGDEREGGAYIWPEIRNDADITLQLESQWGFEDNIAIDCPAGIADWQNNNFHHIVKNTTIWNCPTPIFHGAYQNDFHFLGGVIHGGTVDLRAASATTNRVRFENMLINANGGDYCIVANEGPLKGAAPIMFLNCSFSNFKKKAILNQNPGPGLKTIDVVNCNLSSTSVQVGKSALSGEWIRIQDVQSTSAYQVTKSGTKSIPKFAPDQWGAGNGLKAEYYSLVVMKNSVGQDVISFGDLKLTRTEPNINLFDITHPQIHYAVPPVFAARWTGKILPQYTEPYSFIVMAGGGIRFWIDNKLIIDKWTERYPGENKVIFGSMIAGKQYDLKLEFFNQDDRSGCTLEWMSTTLKREFIPMSQLYS